MNELALFAGAGGGILGGKLLGWRTVCAVEWEPYPASVLCARQNDGLLPPFPIWDDVQTFDGRPWRGIVDVVSGGFPCQAYSAAARGRNTADDLWPEMRRIVADVAPRYVFAENVSRVAIEQAADDLEQMGYVARCVEVSAQDMGADHIRPRCWLLAHADDYGELHSKVNAKVAELQSMDRLKAIGNGQVPLCAATAWRYLSELL
jgi:DNA (cytosine-5)-methyltransferase 1